MTTLLMSSRHTEDDQALWRAAIGRGWSVVRARGICLPEIDDDEVVIYVEALYAATIAGMLGRGLLDPPEDWLVRLPQSFTKRRISLSDLREARRLTDPAFVKPPNDKSFAAQVYDSGASLPSAFDDDMAVLIATPVKWEAEFRCSCLDGEVVTLSPYFRNGELAKATDYQMSDDESDQATRIAEDVLRLPDLDMPRSVVVDVGRISGEGWAVVEANAAWGSGIYGCDPNAVLDVIRHATVQAEKGR